MTLRCQGQVKELSKCGVAISCDRVDVMEQLDTLIRRSHDAPVLLMKHSRTCGTSAMAYDELETFREGRPHVDVVIVDVFADRALSREIASHFGVRHESPQALLLVDGRVAWHGSHYRVTAEALRRAVDEHARLGA